MLETNYYEIQIADANDSDDDGNFAESQWVTINEGVDPETLLREFLHALDTGESDYSDCNDFIRLKTTRGVEYADTRVAELKDLEERIERLISKTPSGDVRNSLTQTNIFIKQALALVSLEEANKGDETNKV